MHVKSYQFWILGLEGVEKDAQTVTGCRHGPLLVSLLVPIDLFCFSWWRGYTESWP